jgi:hypothetical protein
MKLCKNCRAHAAGQTGHHRARRRPCEKDQRNALVAGLWTLTALGWHCRRAGRSSARLQVLALRHVPEAPRTVLGDQAFQLLREREPTGAICQPDERVGQLSASVAPLSSSPAAFQGCASRTATPAAAAAAAPGPSLASCGTCSGTSSSGPVLKNV